MPAVTCPADVRAIVDQLPGAVRIVVPPHWEIGTANVRVDEDTRKPLTVQVACVDPDGGLLWWATFHQGCPDELVRQAIRSAAGVTTG